MADEEVITKDGTITYRSEEFDETYHSQSGAKEEAEKKYSDALKIEKYEKVHIIDVCFGLGYNTAAAIDKFKGTEIDMICLENYDGIVNEITQRNDYPFRSKEILQIVAKEKKYEGEFEGKKINIKLIMEDARESVNGIKDEWADLVFFDPFSPKRCPWMWTKEFFESVFLKMKKGGKLATYSCARMVRDNMKEAGFKVKDGPCVGRRSPGTIAIK